MEGMRKIMESLYQEIQSPHRHSNLGPHKYEATVLNT